LADNPVTGQFICSASDFGDIHWSKPVCRCAAGGA
jgi:hypothetical protein